MKKKLLITLFMAMMICILAFSVSAANEVTLVDGTTVDFEAVFKVQKSGGVENVVTGFNSDYDKNDVTDVIFPDYVAGIECNGLFGKYATAASTTIRTLTFAATDEFFISGDNIFSEIPLTTVTFDPNCVVELRKGSFSGCTSLTQITFPKFKKIAGSAFKGCSNMKSTNDLIFAEGMTEIGGHAFNGCKLLTGTVYFPSTLEKIQEYSFQSSGFTSFDLSKCSKLTAVGGGYGGPFTDCDSITKLDLSGCTNLKEIKSSFAADCSELVEIILPPNLETIPHKAFAHCYKLQSIVFPASLTYVADEAFHSARRDQTVKTFTVYLQSAVEFHATYPFRDSSAKIEYVLLGVSVEDFLAANTFSGITSATVVDYLDPASPWTYETGTSITNHTIVKNYCKSLGLTGEHASDENPCVVNCSVCKLVAPKENPVHTEKSVISYANGYDKVGTKLITCANAGCSHKETKEAAALFICSGYSVPEDGRGQISIGYTVNSEAISEYTANSGKSLKYGVFAVLEKNIGDGNIFDASGNPLANVVKAEVDATYASFEFKISGFTDEYKNINIAMGAYVEATDKESTVYSFMQDGEPLEGAKFVFVSYKGIVSFDEN